MLGDNPNRHRVSRETVSVAARLPSTPKLELLNRGMWIANRAVDNPVDNFGDKLVECGVGYCLYTPARGRVVGAPGVLGESLDRGPERSKDQR